MSDYIKKEEATSIPVISKEHRKYFNSLDDAFETGWNEALACVNMIPSANVVEVVRCKNCDFWNKDENILGGICDEWSDFEDGLYRYTRGDDYCSLGERKEHE